MIAALSAPLRAQVTGTFSVTSSWDTGFVANLTLDDVPETVLAPALLVDDVTVRRANEKNDKLPFYPPPQ